MPAASNSSTSDECSAASSPAHNIIRDPCGPEPEAMSSSLRSMSALLRRLPQFTFTVAAQKNFPNSTQVYSLPSLNTAGEKVSTQGSLGRNSPDDVANDFSRSRFVFGKDKECVFAAGLTKAEV